MCGVEKAFSVLHPKWLVVHSPSHRLLFFVQSIKVQLDLWPAARFHPCHRVLFSAFYRRELVYFSPHKFFRVLFVSGAYTPLAVYNHFVVFGPPNQKPTKLRSDAEPFVCDTSLLAETADRMASVDGSVSVLRGKPFREQVAGVAREKFCRLVRRQTGVAV